MFEIKCEQLKSVLGKVFWCKEFLVEFLFSLYCYFLLSLFLVNVAEMVRKLGTSMKEHLVAL